MVRSCRGRSLRALVLSFVAGLVVCCAAFVVLRVSGESERVWSSLGIEPASCRSPHDMAPSIDTAAFDALRERFEATFQESEGLRRQLQTLRGELERATRDANELEQVRERARQVADARDRLALQVEGLQRSVLDALPVEVELDRVPLRTRVVRVDVELEAVVLDCGEDRGVRLGQSFVHLAEGGGTDGTVGSRVRVVVDEVTPRLSVARIVESAVELSSLAGLLLVEGADES